MGFHGPGKLDGSIVNWVNGALLREVAERAGYRSAFHSIPTPGRDEDLGPLHDTTGVRLMTLPFFPPRWSAAIRCRAGSSA